MLKNKIIAVICILTLILPVFAVEPQNTEVLSEEQAVETVVDQDESDIDTVSNLPENNVNATQDTITTPTPYKQPISKKRVAKKFLLAMFGVVVSSLLIFGILTVYNKIREGFVKKETLPEIDGETSLDTPDDLTGAIKSFLDKTKWN
jgi:hypothetical protein